MDKITHLFSLIFFITNTIYMAFGIYIIQKDYKARLNRVFFAICISLSLWSLGFSFGVTAHDVADCIFWRRIAALGWGLLYSQMLHFFILMTENKIFGRKWLIPLIYLPAAITVYIFAFSTEMVQLQYNLVKTAYGWVNIAENNGWDKFFNLYYTSYILISLGLIWLWGKNSSSVKHKKESRVLIFAIFAAFLLGSVTDILFNSYLDMTSPQMAPVISLIPITAIFISIRRYGLMSIKTINQDETILTDVTRLRIINYLTLALIAGGFLSIISRYYIYGTDLIEALKFSAIFVVLGVLTQITQRLRLTENTKDNLLLILVSFLVVFVTFFFINSASITVWAFPFVLLIIFIVFNKRKMLVVLALTTLLTQLIMWVMVPDIVVRVEGSDHIVRIGLFALGCWVAFFVNKIYVLRLRENAEQIRAQKLVSEISSEFVNANVATIEEKINSMLNRMGYFFEIDQIFVCLLDEETNTISSVYKWFNEETINRIGDPEDISLNAASWWMSQINTKEPIHIPAVAELPEKAKEEMQKMTKGQVQSLLAIPMLKGVKVRGFLRLDSTRSLKRWNSEHISIIGIIANVVSDALTKVEAEEKQNHMAYFDQLTGLPNRMLFKDRANQAIQLMKRTDNIIGVLFLDLDSFKAINDTMGHDGGDELLNIVSQELSNSVRSSDTVGRFGGDEFLILMNNVSKGEDIIKIADNIMNIFKHPFTIKGQEYYLTVSAGVAVYPVDGEDVDTLIKNADVAMYNAKEKGKNQYVLCTADMKNEVQRMMELTNSLYRARERNELVLHYQPQVNVKTGRIVGLEALMRWNHPEIGRISPNVFIPLAEKTGLINPIGEWALREACRQNKKWLEMGLPPVRIAVNISYIQLKNPKLITQVEHILKEFRLDPEFLELEITETVASKESNYILDTLEQLKSLGLSISIDDFGTEYSSLSRLKLLPIDRIKMDMQFVHGIDGNEKDRAYAKLIIDLAKNLGLKLIAEGVETATQMEFLYGRRCDEIQGYYYYKPMPAEEIEALLRNK